MAIRTLLMLMLLVSQLLPTGAAVAATRCGRGDAAASAAMVHFDALHRSICGESCCCPPDACPCMSAPEESSPQPEAPAPQRSAQVRIDLGLAERPIAVPSSVRSASRAPLTCAGAPLALSGNALHAFLGVWCT